MMESLMTEVKMREHVKYLQRKTGRAKMLSDLMAWMDAQKETLLTSSAPEMFQSLVEWIVRQHTDILRDVES